MSGSDEFEVSHVVKERFDWRGFLLGFVLWSLVSIILSFGISHWISVGVQADILWAWFYVLALMIFLYAFKDDVFSTKRVVRHEFRRKDKVVVVPVQVEVYYSDKKNGVKEK